MKTNIHTSKSLKSQDGEFENFHYQLTDGERYLLTDGEADWLFNWVKGKYIIADHLRASHWSAIQQYDLSDQVIETYWEREQSFINSHPVLKRWLAN